MPIYRDEEGRWILTIENPDIVEVVRCKDCKYFNPHVMECNGIGKWFGLENEWSANDYCSKGEKREDG